VNVFREPWSPLLVIVGLAAVVTVGCSEPSTPPAPGALPAGAALSSGAGVGPGSGAAAPVPPPADPTPLTDAERARWAAAFPLTPLAAPTLSGTDARTRALRAAFTPYRRGDYPAAASAFDGIRIDHPDDPTATLYLGICRLFQDEVPNGLELLRGIPGTATPDEMAEAEWYGLVGIARLRDPSAARPEAERLCRAGGRAAARACAALDALGPPPAAPSR